MSLSLLEEYIETGNSLAIDDLLNGSPNLSKQKTSHDISPLLLACYYNKPQIVKVLLKHLDELTIHEAAAAGLLEQVQAMVENTPSLLDEVSDHGFTPLGIATHFGNEDVVHFLLAKGADANVQSQNGYNVYPLHTAIGSGFEHIAKMLMEAGAEVNVLQSSRTSPLHVAAQNGNIDLIILLLEHGALVEIQNDMGKTASDLAAEKGYADIASILKV
ncbi:ankyrin repeat domain-containing protein [Parapedobacter tibetensis]|uniref:ankyrin repeat domain-containing protein n=1 Tax=Parapedobacter tibetensis TaxID=2972951 RepID=UPI00214D4188|nr:ankyrin repeat domain-containing protein [Parapedobacter tibetensis]